MEFPTSLGIRVLTVAVREQFDWRFSRLCAPYWRLYRNENGIARVAISGDGPPHDVTLEPLKLHLIPPDTQFDVTVDHPLDHFYVHFNLELHQQEPVPGVFTLDEGPGVQAIAERLRFSAGQVDPFAVTGLVCLALSALPSSAWRDRSSDALVREVEEIARSGADVSLASVASAFGCSERTVRRRFLAAHGVTPQQYALTKRIDRACELLHFSRLPIEEIAEECGFSDRYYFTRTFSRLRGMGPAAFRDVVEGLAR